MYEINCPATLVTPGGTIQFNQDLGGGAMYWLENVTGLDGAPRRATFEDASVTDGGIWHDFYKGTRHITIEGMILVANDTAWNQVVQRNTMGQGLEDALDSIATLETVTGTYSWTPSGLALRTVTIRNDIGINFTGKLTKSFVFGLVAINPTIL